MLFDEMTLHWKANIDFVLSLLSIGDILRQKCQQQRHMTVSIVLALAPWVSHFYIGIVFKAIMPATATHESDHCTCLGPLGWPDPNRNDPICVALPKVAKATTVTWLSCVAVTDGFDNKHRQCKWSITDEYKVSSKRLLLPVSQQIKKLIQQNAKA